MLIEIAKGSLSNRGIIIPYSDIRKNINSKQSLFRSYFAFDEKIKEHLKNRKTPSGYIGNFYLTDIILDIDLGGDSLLGCQQRLVATLNTLIKNFNLTEENYIVWYSGTGFHIQIPDIFNFTVSPTLPQQVKATVEHYFPNADTKPINARGLIRVGFTLNEKSGLYKTPIPDEWLWNDLDENKLKELASVFKPYAVPYDTNVETFEDKIIDVTAKKEMDLPSHNPTNLVTCMQILYNEGEKRGSRHESIMRLTSWQRRNGTPLQATVAMMRQFAPSLDGYEIERIVTDVYNKGYQYGCNDKIMRKYCDAKCIFHKNKDYAPNITTSLELEKEFHIYARGNWQEESLNLKNFFGLNTDFWVEPESMCTFIGGTGLNKTSILQNIIVKEQKLTPILYLSTEFSNRLLFRRFIQIAHDMGKDEVLAYYKVNTNHLSNAINHIHYLNASPNVHEIEKLISKHNSKVVVIDVVDDIKYPNMMHGNASQEMIAVELKQIAMKYGVIILLVHHISKGEAFTESGLPKRLTVHSGKGSSAIEQKSDLVIGIEGKQNSNERLIRSLKSRDNEPFEKLMKVDMETFRFYVE